MGFDFEKMVVAFEAVAFADWDAALGRKPQEPPRLPRADSFLAAVSEMALLFDHLGSGFAFVRRDLCAKITVLRSRYSSDVDLTDLVLKEYPNGSGVKIAVGLPSPSASRTLLRLMWATRFLDVLMRELGAAFSAKDAVCNGHPPQTLRDCVSLAYNTALAEHHTWAVRRAVATALYLLPSKEVFVEKVGVDLLRRDEFFMRITTALRPIVNRMFAFYDEHELRDLP